MGTRVVKLSSLKPSPYNPRVVLKPGDPEYKKLKRSIEEFGCVEPLVVNKRTGNLVGGHQRLAVLRDLGYESVDVVIVDLPIEREKVLNVALNQIEGKWDEQKLADLLTELTEMPEIDVELTGFDTPDIQDLISRVLDSQSLEGNEDDFDVDAALDAQHPAITQSGELIELGHHRLLCGDATSADDVRGLMDGRRAILFATDPPYLVDYDGTNHPAKRGHRDKNKDWSDTYGITWDDADANPFLYEDFCRVAVAEAIKTNAAWYCWHASRRQAMVEGVWKRFGAFVHQQIIWVKDRQILGRSWYSWQHEPCFFGWVRPNKPPRVSDDYPSTIWQIPTVRAGQSTEHPTSKPVEVFAIPMRQHTRRGAICYEPFCGSGSQLIAAEKLGRRCYALEISPHYCDVIVRRWIAFVGEQKAPPELIKRYRMTQENAA